jgi:hypothetical protein
MRSFLKALSDCPPSVLVAEFTITPVIWYFFGLGGFVTANVLFGLHYLLVMDRLTPARDVQRPIFSDQIFRLDAFPSSHYTQQFELAPNSAQSSPGDNGYRTIGGKWLSNTPEKTWSVHSNRNDAPYAAYCLEGPEQFTIHLPVSNGELAREAVVLAQTVLGSVSEMDAAARAYTRALYGTHDDESYAAQLAYIEVPETGNKVIFRYFAANLNADWYDSFDVERDGRWQHCPLTN